MASMFSGRRCCGLNVVARSHFASTTKTPSLGRLYSSCHAFKNTSQLRSQVSAFNHSRKFQAFSTPKRQFQKSATPSVVKPPKFAFAFDIDGVLYRSGKPFPFAIKALKFLQAHKIPFILLTNGGGKHETERVAELSSKFDINLNVDNFIQSHTPFQEMAKGSDVYEALADRTVLVTGGNPAKIRDIARQYGFKNVVTPADILMDDPHVWPFNDIWTDYYSKTAKPLPVPVTPSNPDKSLKIDAIFVFNDPRDWALDTQIFLDLMMSKNGVLGTLSEKNGDKSLPNNGWQQDGQPKLIYSNPDLFWAAQYHLNRLGQGGFRTAFDGVWAEVTGGAKLEKTVIGKPHAETYHYAEHVLNTYRKKMLKQEGEANVPDLDRVFMVGDNPESDIRGANDFKSPHGTEWSSILVKTGVYPGHGVPKYEPTVIVEDVLEGVKWALKQQGYTYDEADFID